MTQRFDLKCGNGAISAGEKCHKGTASRGRTAAKVALGAGIGAVALGAPSFALGHRSGHLTHGSKSNPGMSGGLANAAVPAAVGAIAGGALTAGALALRSRNKKPSVSQGLEKGTTKQLVAHRQALTDELISKYGKPIRNQRELSAFDKWAAKQPLQAEIEAVNSILLERHRSRTDAAGRRCGSSTIAANKQCRKGGAFPTRAAIATGLGVAALGAGAYALNRRRNRIVPVTVSQVPQPPSAAPRLRGASPSSRASLPGDRTTRALPGDRTTRRITGTTPYGLLPPKPPKSKTQRLRENSALAARRAERDIGRAARAEITRAGAVANAMASAGEATGMSTKTTLRELRLRVEAARRRYEPGYRRGRPAVQRPQPQLPESGSRFQVPFQPPTPRRPSPDSIPIDPRPRRQRRRPSGFGRTDNYIPVYAPVALRGIR